MVLKATNGKTSWHAVARVSRKLGPITSIILMSKFSTVDKWTDRYVQLAHTFLNAATKLSECVKDILLECTKRNKEWYD
jgi:hypothetical protein